MRNHLLITLFLGIILCTQISSCSSKIEKNENRTSETETPQLLDKDGAQAWYTLMKKVKPEIANPLVDVEITPQEYDELKAFADKLAQGLSGQKEVSNTLWHGPKTTLSTKTATIDPMRFGKAKKEFAKASRDYSKSYVIHKTSRHWWSTAKCTAKTSLSEAMHGAVHSWMAYG